MDAWVNKASSLPFLRSVPGGDLEMEAGLEIERLPEECLSHVLSFTTPRDSCRSSLVSTTFRSAAGSDTIWRRFLPSDYPEILSRAIDPVDFASKKELYFRLFDSILIDGGRKSFALDKKSGAKCYTVCARDLSIIWGNDQRYWIWVPMPDSRFAEVAELRAVWWLDISGRIDCRVLSPNTTYKAYLLFKLAPVSGGLKSPAQQVSVRVGAHISEHDVCLQPNEGEGDNQRQQLPHARSDGWMEIELGEFFNEDGGDGEVQMSFSQVRVMNLKRGLIIEGIQVRPK